MLVHEYIEIQNMYITAKLHFSNNDIFPLETFIKISSFKEYI